MTSTYQRSRPEKLTQNEGGTVLLPGLFMLLILVASLYAIIGLGKTILAREGLQDAADAAAFSSAIFHARGMNLIVFINLIMAALVAVLVAIKLAQSLCILAITLLSAASLFTFGAAAAGIVPLTQASVQLEQVYQRGKKVVRPLLATLHQTQRATSVIVPWVAGTDGMIEAARSHPEAKGAFALPGRLMLPVEADEFSILCGKGTEFAVSIAAKPLPIPRFLKSKVEDAAENMGTKLSRFLCGDGKEAAPSHTETHDKTFPSVPGAGSCEREPNGDSCKKAIRDAERSLPSGRGVCIQDCHYDQLYESNARRARHTCEPRRGFAPKTFTWQSHEVRASFVMRQGQWQEEARKLSRPQLHQEKRRPPCGRDGTLNDEEWNLDSGSRTQESPTPLCTQNLPELERLAPDGSRLEVLYEEATRIFQCVTEVETTTQLAQADDALGGAGAERRSPHRVEKGLLLGDDAFQLRTIAFGKRPTPGRARQFVELPSRRNSRVERTGTDKLLDTVKDEAMAAAAASGHLSFAQAEYFFDHSGEVAPSEWMWNMAWTARLRRIRMPTGKERTENERQRKNANKHSSSLADEFGTESPNNDQNCAAATNSSCTQTRDTFSLLSQVLVH